MRSLLSLLLLIPLALPAQTPEPTIRTTVNEVLLDVVVRDKHAHIIRNLRPDEIHVFEDGVPQRLRHFEFIDGRSETLAGPTSKPSSAAAPSAPPNTSEAPHTVNELRDISVISVVIADLDPRGRKLTMDAMRKFVGTELPPKTYIGVFSLGLAGLRNIQPYTNDSEKISAAVGRAARNALLGQLATANQESAPDTSHGAADTQQGPATDPTQGPLSDPNGTPTGPSAGPAGAITASAAGPAAEIARMMESNWVSEMHDVYVDSQRYLTPLRALVQSQAAIPGRKVILLFSAGLPVHADTDELLKSVISTANRSNVTIYALDTRGTTTQSTLDYSRNALRRAARKSMDQQMSPDKTVTPGEVISGEMAETSIHLDSRANLAELAEDTGGQLLPDSLDLVEPLQRAVQDARTHYELTYSPTDSTADGTFRKIEVRVSRRGAMVFARSGYYALPVLNGRQVYPFEMATLKALNTKPQLHQFIFHAAALQFRPGTDRTQLAFVFQSPTRDLTVVRDGQWAKVHVCVTALIKDEQGHIVQKISKDIPYEVPAAKMSELQKGVVSFTTPFTLAPGHYTVETAAVDRKSMKASVSRLSIFVGPPSGLAMSDITVVRRVDANVEPLNSANPLQSRGEVITPELFDVTAQQSRGEVTFYALAYPAQSVQAPVEVELEIWRDGRLIMRSPESPVPTDASGAAPILASVSTQKLPGGSYMAQISVECKGQTVTKRVAFTLGAAS